MVGNGEDRLVIVDKCNYMMDNSVNIVIRYFRVQTCHLRVSRSHASFGSNGWGAQQPFPNSRLTRTEVISGFVRQTGLIMTRS